MENIFFVLHPFIGNLKSHRILDLEMNEITIFLISIEILASLKKLKIRFKKIENQNILKILDNRNFEMFKKFKEKIQKIVE